MNTLLLILCSVLLAVILVFMFLPLLRGSYRGAFYFTMGGGRGKHLSLQRKVLIENLRDIAIEKDGAKMNAGEFEELAEPLSRELEKVEQGLSSVSGTHQSAAGLRHFCPVCGARGTLVTAAGQATYCEQCGSEFSEKTASTATQQ